MKDPSEGSVEQRWEADGLADPPVDPITDQDRAQGEALVKETEPRAEAEGDSGPEITAVVPVTVSGDRQPGSCGEADFVQLACVGRDCRRIPAHRS